MSVMPDPPPDPATLPPPETKPQSLNEVIDRLMTLETKVEAISPTAPPVEPVEPVDPPTGSAISTPFPKVATGGQWSWIAGDKYGWLTGDLIKQRSEETGLNGKAWRRWSIDNSPDGVRSVHQHISKGDEVNPIRMDTGQFQVRSDARYILLRFQMYQRGWQGFGGKWFAVMGGRGMAGGAYCANSSAKHGTGGWSNVIMHPELGKQNAMRGYAYSANREDMGARKGFGDTYGSGRIPLPQDQWFTCEALTEVVPGAKGSGQILQDGKVVAEQKGVDWVGKGKEAKGIWLRWRFMYGGNPDQLLARNVVDQWIRNVELWSHA